MIIKFWRLFPEICSNINNSYFTSNLKKRPLKKILNKLYFPHLTLTMYKSYKSLYFNKLLERFFGARDLGYQVTSEYLTFCRCLIQATGIFSPPKWKEILILQEIQYCTIYYLNSSSSTPIQSMCLGIDRREGCSLKIKC